MSIMFEAAQIWECKLEWSRRFMLPLSDLISATYNFNRNFEAVKRSFLAISCLQALFLPNVFSLSPSRQAGDMYKF